jgi:hypothetical protein
MFYPKWSRERKIIVVVSVFYIVSGWAAVTELRKSARYICAMYITVIKIKLFNSKDITFKRYKFIAPETNYWVRRRKRDSR